MKPIEIRLVNLCGRALTKSQYRNELPRASLDIDTAMKAIEPILATVATASESDLLDLGEKFDGVRPQSIRVPAEEITKALASLDSGVRDALEEAIVRIKRVHSDQSRTEKKTLVVDGGEVTHRWIPVDRVGLYVPGGRAVYPSSVIMNVVPAQIAQVPSIAVASPPQIDNNGLPNKTILATCALLGITEVYAIGGAQAVAMFAYSAVAREVAADLISQAEHDVIAAAVLVTPSRKLAEEVVREVNIRVAATKHHERIREALTGIQSAIVLVDDEAQGIDVVNAYAAEHLELVTQNPERTAASIRNAGAVFLGRFTPVSLGDYSAGSNHVLPTGGCACHSSGLSVQSFLKGVSFIKYDEAAFRDIANNVITLANSEDLPAHGEAMSARLEGEK